MDTNRNDRLAKNEALFRSVNERISELAATLRMDDIVGGESTEAFLCECVDPECMEQIRLTRPEYEHIRRTPVTFAVAPGHIVREIERTAEETDRYWVVEKLDDAGEIARATDPRS